MAYRRYAFRRRRRFPRRSFRRTRRTYKRGYGRRQRYNALTIQSARGGGLQYRSRRMSRRAWKSNLWRTTLHQDHWRSTANEVSGLATPGVIGLMTVSAFIPLATQSNIGFWETGRGARPKDNSKTVPNFSGVVLRGGKITLSVLLPEDFPISQSLRAKVWVMRTGQAPDFNTLPGTVNLDWDPSCNADVDSEIGKTVFFKEAILNGTSNPSLTIEYRLGPQKIDMDDFAFSFGYQPVFVVAVGGTNSNAIFNIGIMIGHNVSFAADARP